MQKTQLRLGRGPLPQAIAVALGLGGAGVSLAQTSAGNELEEVVVTATRRSENLQSVPIAITALTNATLGELNVQTLDDFLRYLPNVTTAGVAPGQDEVYMRGLSTTHQGSQVVGGTGAFPNVAVYLDDQSVQLPGRNLDVYAADLARIEVLEGPQGTLYGAGAQAGAVRYITNKPKLDVDEGSVDASYSTTAHGDPSASGVAMLNVPVIPGTFALRAVIYDDSRGGYIHNVPATFTRSPTDIGIANYFGGVVPPGSTSLSNSDLVSRAFNPLTYKGIRVSGLYQMNEDWNLLVQQSYQSMEADGIFAYDPAARRSQRAAIQSIQGPGQVRGHRLDREWPRRRPQARIHGRISREKRRPDGRLHQLRAWTLRRILSVHMGAIHAGATCYSPSSIWHNIERNTHQSHEFRVSTPDDARVRAIGGIFWEDYRIQTSQNFLYADAQAGFPPLTPRPRGGGLRSQLSRRGDRIPERHHPRLRAEGGLRGRRVRSHSPLVDADRRDPLFPLRQFRPRAVGLGVWLPEYRSLRACRTASSICSIFRRRIRGTRARPP